MDKISCEIKKLLVLWPDPSFLYKKNVYFIFHTKFSFPWRWSYISVTGILQLVLMINISWSLTFPNDSPFSPLAFCTKLSVVFQEERRSNDELDDLNEAKRARKIFPRPPCFFHSGLPQSPRPCSWETKKVPGTEFPSRS